MSEDTPIDDLPGVETRHIAYEDLVLYAFGIVFIVMFWFLFDSIRKNEAAHVTTIITSMQPWQPREADMSDLLFYKAQLAQATLRYQQAERASVAISARRNFGFLVGTVLALLGCLIAIRGSRAPLTANIKAKALTAKITTTSAGALIVLMGGAIVMATILNNDRVAVQDNNIAFAPAATAKTDEATKKTISTQESNDIQRSLENTTTAQAQTDTTKTAR